MMSTRLLTCELRPAQFAKISQLVHRVSGIALRPGKEELVRGRLSKRLHRLGLDNFDAYLAYVNSDTSGQELITMIDILTTNKTGFFRELQHFTYLQQWLGSRRQELKQPLRFWSAGCSSGEEPYSLAIVLCETSPGIEQRDVRILATDISSSMLAVARQAVYDQEKLRQLPPQLLHKYFTLVRSESRPTYRLKEPVRAMVRLARLNLMQEWPMRGPFDAIFCRNVMIYFDKQTQDWLVQRFWKMLRPGGHLFIGHSESLSPAAHNFRYVQPAVYMK